MTDSDRKNVLAQEFLDVGPSAITDKDLHHLIESGRGLKGDPAMDAIHRRQRVEKGKALFNEHWPLVSAAAGLAMIALIIKGEIDETKRHK